MATLNAGSEKPLGLFCFGGFRLQNTVSGDVVKMHLRINLLCFRGFLSTVGEELKSNLIES